MVGPDFIAPAYNIVLKLKPKPQANSFPNTQILFLMQASRSESCIKAEFQAVVTLIRKSMGLSDLKSLMTIYWSKMPGTAAGWLREGV